MASPILQKPDIRDLTKAELEQSLENLGVKPVHAKAVFRTLYRKGAADFSGMTGVPAPVLKAVSSKYSLCHFPAPEKKVSMDGGTKKLLFVFPGKAPAESVILPGKGRTSACLSSQSGCACGCSFCATGKLGLIRDLKPSEIIAQFSACLKEAGGKLDSVVFMGMGEPFLNWRNLKKAILIISDPAGWHFPQSKMTVSTIGIIPVMKELVSFPLKIKLAISLVSASEKVRAELVPMEKKYPLKKIMEAARDYTAKKKEQIFFEYILFYGINDSTQDARELSELLKGLDCRLNLIPYNSPDGKTPYAGPDSKAKAFQKYMITAGVRTYLRAEKGSDIRAACGQLGCRHSPD